MDQKSEIDSVNRCLLAVQLAISSGIDGMIGGERFTSKASDLHRSCQLPEQAEIK